MVEINLEKKHLYLFTSILLFFIGAGFVFAAGSPAVSHTTTEIEGLSDYFLTNGLLNPKSIVCPTGQCLKELDVRGNPRCEQYNAPATLTNDWVDVGSTFLDCPTSCISAGFTSGGAYLGSWRCIGIGGFGTYVSSGACMLSSSHSQGQLVSCYCIEYSGSFTCPTQPTQPTQPVSNKVTEPVSCSMVGIYVPGTFLTGSGTCYVSCPNGWAIEGCDHLYQMSYSYGIQSASSTTNHLNCNCVKYF